MASKKSKAKRATTLSISLTAELSAEVAARVASGMYGSASELVREALRRFLHTEPAHWTNASRVAEARPAWAPGPLSQRFQDAAGLQGMREDLVRARLRAEMPEASEEEIDMQLGNVLKRERQESDDPHLRPVSAARLRRILGK
jgi:putative addiction module CopG family antidote